jgi:molybdenum cofactor sulfurtransferase
MMIEKTNADYVSTEMQTAYEAFLRAYPDYEKTLVLDDLRKKEYARLDKHRHVYLDYTGGGLHADSQVRDHMALLQADVFGNPHSMNPTSLPITQRIEATRRAVLDYFNASPDEYYAIFTPNASGALKLVGESYPFDQSSHLVQTWDNHNSVNGIREFARSKGAKITFVPFQSDRLRIDETLLFEALDQPSQGGNRLFTYPAQSNLSGVQHPLEWIDAAHQRGWDVVVDGAAFVPTNRLDLSRYKPDFVPLSFYKMFGYPTGIGCLLARQETLKKLQRPWFAGGTIVAVSIQSDWHYLLHNWEAFEDGTLNYLGIPAITFGLDHIRRIGIDTIHERVVALTGWLLDSMSRLQHSNGKPIVRVYGPRTTEMRGGTIAFNFYDPTGHVVDERIVETRATSRQISLRAGCFCNPGAAESAFDIHKEATDAHAPGKVSGNVTFDGLLHGIGMQSAGAIRISVGLVSNFADVYQFIEFAQSFRDEIPDTGGLTPRLHC